ncbi:MAG: hypothetical protein A2090_08415 [Deltaproteobacteria bacterium GWD2_42_10]|nr:MAG: hypothetical protein A2067_05605 [Deltaproteobacteria bacterium GWB2_42_7]OGP42100.1 MAG: hypothetical protein A2090_08415 [Deltaproteobacteria bacterium GWD2_42_10]
MKFLPKWKGNFKHTSVIPASPCPPHRGGQGEAGIQFPIKDFERFRGQVLKTWMRPRVFPSGIETFGHDINLIPVCPA